MHRLIHLGVFPWTSGPQPFSTRNGFHGRQFFHGPGCVGRGAGARFPDDPTILHLSCTLLLSHQLHVRSTDTRSQRLGTPALDPVPSDAAYTGFALTKELFYKAETQAQSPGVHAAFSLFGMPTLTLAKMIRMCPLHNRTLISMSCASTLLLSAARGS